MKGHRQDLARAKTPAAKLKVFQAISDYLDLQLMENRAAATVMRMVINYERSIREDRLEEIKGWRKALALGAAGLAGLSPMRAQAAEPVPPAPHTQSIVSPEAVGQVPRKWAPLTSEQASAALNFIVDADPEGGPHVKRVDYDKATDSYVWTGPKTGKRVVKDRAWFNNRVVAAYEATAAMNFAIDQDNARNNLKNPHVREIDYDEKTGNYTWKGPTTGEAMSMKGTDFQDKFLTFYLKSAETPAPGTDARYQADEAITDAEVMLDQTWQNLSPETKEQLRPQQLERIKLKDSQKDQDKLMMIKDRIAYLQNLTGQKGAPTAAVTEPPVKTTRARTSPTGGRGRRAYSAASRRGQRTNRERRAFGYKRARRALYRKRGDGRN